MSAQQPSLFEPQSLPQKPKSAPVLGNQHHAAVSKMDLPRLTTQYGKILNFLSDGRWHDQYAMAEKLAIPQGSVGSQIRNARVAGWLIEKRRRDAKGGTWEYRLAGRKPGQEQD